MTGTRTGALAAFLFGIPIKRSICCIITGILISGVVVTLASLGIIGALKGFI